MANFDPVKFWRDPAKSDLGATIPNCQPEYYLDLVNVSALVVDVMQRYAKRSWTILEIGCGTGRNLVALKQAGFAKVKGIEISKRAIEVGRERFPEYAEIEVINAPVEEAIKSLRQVSVIFTQGCLMHLPYELDWVLEEISRKARKLILTNEGEMARNKSIHVWRRNYQTVFEGLGWRQVEMEIADKYPPLPKTTIKRVFLRSE
jgi:SAM-dependent methyltransferase